MENAARALDVGVEVITPENIAFQYRVAGPFLRLAAYLIDAAIRIAAGLVGVLTLWAAFGTAGLSQVGVAAGLLLAFLLAWFYGGLFETFWNGQTPGKRCMGIRVVTVEGQPINALQAVLRNVLRVVDGQPLIFAQVGLWAASMNDRFQRLGDLACGTMVVVDQRQWFRGLAAVRDAEALAVAAQVPAAFQAGPTLARALAAYAERRDAFWPDRRREIARPLAELLAAHLGLPAGTDPDLLLRGVYHHVFAGGADAAGTRRTAR
jgi:uncharacterized RDD family membrane protein YckC